MKQRPYYIQRRRTTATTISIIIVSYNTKSYLRRCLDSIFRYPLIDGNFETIVIDNASFDRSGEMVRKSYPQVALIQNAKNHGFAYACNQGMRKASGEFFLLLNPDTQLLPDSLNKMVEFLNENPDIGAAGGLMMDENGKPQPSCLVFPTYWNLVFSRSSIFNKLSFIKKHSRRLRELPEDITDVDALSGGFLFLRREALNQVGLLDERYFIYLEDIDIAKRLKDVGWRVVFYPESKIIHTWGASSTKTKKKAFWWHHLSMYKYFHKHRPEHSILNTVVLIGLVGHYVIWWISTFFKEKLKKRREQ